jgi:hypothetical protein
MKICSVQRYYIPCGTRHRFPNPIKYPGRFMEWMKKTGNNQLSILEPLNVGITTTQQRLRHDC